MEYIISDLFGKIANAVGFGGGDKAPPKLSEGCQQMTNQVVANIVGSGDRVNLYAAVKQVREEAQAAGIGQAGSCTQQDLGALNAKHIEVAAATARQTNVASR
jgi:hypothetical protein